MSSILRLKEDVVLEALKDYLFAVAMGMSNPPKSLTIKISAKVEYI